MTTTATVSAVDEAAQMIRQWTHGDVLGSLSVTEGYILAALFEQLDQVDVADHIVRQVWDGEAADSRDPLPWVNAHGSRLSDDEHATSEPGEGDERFRFRPRARFADEPDVIAYWAARECADCGAYEGLLHTTGGITRCAACTTTDAA